MERYPQVSETPQICLSERSHLHLHVIAKVSRFLLQVAVGHGVQRRLELFEPEKGASRGQQSLIYTNIQICVGL